MRNIPWKKIGIYAGVILIVFFLGFGAARYSVQTDVLNLRGRIQLLTRQYEEAVSAEQRARAEATGLNTDLLAANKTIGELRARETELTKSVEHFKSIIGELRESIRQFLGAFDGITGAIGQSGVILQDSLRILYGIAERNGIPVEKGTGE